MTMRSSAAKSSSSGASGSPSCFHSGSGGVLKFAGLEQHDTCAVGSLQNAVLALRSLSDEADT